MLFVFIFRNFHVIETLVCTNFLTQVVDVLRGTKQKRHRDGYAPFYFGIVCDALINVEKNITFQDIFCGVSHLLRRPCEQSSSVFLKDRKLGHFPSHFVVQFCMFVSQLTLPCIIQYSVDNIVQR